MHEIPDDLYGYAEDPVFQEARGLMLFGLHCIPEEKLPLEDSVDVLFYVRAKKENVVPVLSYSENGALKGRMAVSLEGYMRHFRTEGTGVMHVASIDEPARESRIYFAPYLARYAYEGLYPIHLRAVTEFAFAHKKEEMLEEYNMVNPESYQRITMLQRIEQLERTFRRAMSALTHV